jgi:hypothetical protein
MRHGRGIDGAIGFESVSWIYVCVDGGLMRALMQIRCPASVIAEFRTPRWYVGRLTISGAFALTVCGKLILAVLADVDVVVGWW